MTGRATRKKKQAEETEQSTMEMPKSKKPKTMVGIDMSVVPESLRREGFGEEEKHKPKIPASLLCPVCKELFVNAEMNNCGHTVCATCVEGTHSRLCPVCKESCYGKPTPNYIVKQLIEEQFPEELKERMVKVNEITELKRKLESYMYSDRFVNLDKRFNEIIQEHFYIHYKTFVELLCSSSIVPAIKEEEALYFLSIKLGGGNQAFLVGEIVIRRAETEVLLAWLETQKIKKKTDVQKFLPILTMARSFTQSSSPIVAEHWGRFSKICKVDIGAHVTAADFKNHPAFWIKDLDLGVVRHIGSYCCGMHHPRVSYEDEYSDSDDYDSSDDDDMF